IGSAGGVQFCPRCGNALPALRSGELGEAILPGGKVMRSVGVAYGLWGLCLVAFAGIHRFYAGKYVTGFLWLFTWGLLGVGSFIDLFLINGMIEKANRKALARASL